LKVCSDRPVKKMIGGIVGWKDEGFAVVTDESDLIA
jgi:hypothetical protein